MSVFFELVSPPRAAGLVAILSRASRIHCQYHSFPTTSRRMSSKSSRSYTDAIALLNTLASNRTVISSISDSSRDMNLDAIPEMLDWTRKAGYEASDLSKHGLKCIHVAGTKGKGSVCAMVESILLQYRGTDSEGKIGNSLGKIGLYTSPHILDVRERIRIDGSPISKTLFTRYFFELWDRFSEAAPSAGHDDCESPSNKPGYFRYLTIMAFHAFIREGVQTGIIECGIGGEYDSTNILPAETVTASAISRLGIDHVGMLGDTVEKIAWHKAGIMKERVPAYTVAQEPGTLRVLEERAKEKGVELTVVGRLDTFEKEGIQLGLQGDFQKDNASLAVAVATSHLQSLDISDGLPSPDTPLPRKFVTGLETVSWPGRCQTIVDGNTEFLLDGAHTRESIHVAADWFRTQCTAAKESSRPVSGTMLIFNQDSSTRDAKQLLSDLLYRVDRNLTLKGGKHLMYVATSFTYAAFCTNTPFMKEAGGMPDLSLQESLAGLYKTMDRNQKYITCPSIEEAIEMAYRVSRGGERILVLITGSLYLVGGALKVLEAEKVGGEIKRRVIEMSKKEEEEEEDIDEVIESPVYIKKITSRSDQFRTQNHRNMVREVTKGVLELAVATKEVATSRRYAESPFC